MYVCNSKWRSFPSERKCMKRIVLYAIVYRFSFARYIVQYDDKDDLN